MSVISSRSSYSERGTRRLDTIAKSHGEKFVANLRKAFEEADQDKVGYVTFEQWKNSNIKDVLGDLCLTDYDFEVFFKRIDANSNGFIDWNEIVRYILNKVKTSDSAKNNEAINFIRKIPTVLPKKSQLHRDMIHTILINNHLGEYITISHDSIKFWRISDLEYVKSIQENVKIVTGTFFESIQLLVLLSINRTMLFYDIASFVKCPIELYASPTPKMIKSLSQREALEVYFTLSEKVPPMFNMPKTVQVANQYRPDSPYVFFLGDDRGYIEAFSVLISKGKSGVEYGCKHVAKAEIHRNSVTRIALVSDDNLYASSSTDGTVKFWRFDDEKYQFSVSAVFCTGEPVNTFTYLLEKQILITSGNSCDSCVWSTDPPRKISKLSGYYKSIIFLCNYVTTTNESYILSMSNRNEFKLWDSSYYRMVKIWSDTGTIGPGNKFSAAVFDEKRRVLICASNHPVKWGEDLKVNDKTESITSHTRSIVGLFFSNEFGVIVSVDSGRCFKTHALDGKLKSSHTDMSDAPMSDICTSALDNSGRRIITSTVSNEMNVWNFNSGGIINTVSTPKQKSFVSILKYGKINNRDILVRVSCDKTITVHTEISRGNFDIYSTFEAHKHDITDVVFYRNEGILSCDVGGDIVFWNFSKKQVTHKSSISAQYECMTVLGCYLFVGDSAGRLRVFQVPDLKCLYDQSNSCITAPHSVSAITSDPINNYIYAADTLGYLCRFVITLNPFGIKGDGFWRCHLDEITHIIVCNDFVVTAGVDQCMRMWHCKDMEYVGLLNDTSHWEFDRDSWELDRPFAPDPIHMTTRIKIIQPTHPIRRPFHKSRETSVSSSKSSEAFKSENTMSEENDRDVENINTENFNFMELKRKFDDFYSLEPINKKPEEDDTDSIKPLSTGRNINQLEPMIVRSEDIEATIKMLQNLTPSNISFISKKDVASTSRTNLSKISTYKALKMPISTQRSRLRKAPPKKIKFNSHFDI